MRVLAILRAEQFSPNSVEKDRAIMMAVVERLRRNGHDVEVTSEERVSETGGRFPVILSMGRLPATIEWLKSQRQACVINTPEGVERCSRSRLTRIMQAEGTPMPPEKGRAGYWLKRGDAAAQTKGDVQYAANEEELTTKIKEFESKGICDYVVSAHVEGDLVKFYGVSGSGFFRYFYPTDDGDSKFGDERRNGVARHYRFSAIDLQQASERLAAAVGVSVYGGDCIVREDGSWFMIDFNDWPSFSRCREEAADAMVTLVENRIVKQK